MSTAVATLNKELREALALLKGGIDACAEAGARLNALKPRYKHGEWTPALTREAGALGVKVRMAQTHMKEAKNPAAKVKRLEAAQAYKQKRNPIAHLPDYRPTPEDRMSARTFVAMGDRTRKALLSPAESREHGKYHEYQTTALEALKALIAKSNLPGIMGMTPDQIIEVIKKV